jgi:hypothetical protein
MRTLHWWSPELLDCFRGAEDLFNLCFLDTPAEQMPGQIFQHIREMDDTDVEPKGGSYSQADRLRLKLVACRIAALVKGGSR